MPALDTVNLSVLSLSPIVNKLTVCESIPLTANVISSVVSLVIVAPALTTNWSFAVNVVNVPAAGVVAPIVASTVPDTVKSPVISVKIEVSVA